MTFLLPPGNNGLITNNHLSAVVKTSFFHPKNFSFFKSKFRRASDANRAINWLRPKLPLEYQTDFFRDAKKQKRTVKRSPLSLKKSCIIYVWQDAKYANSLNFKKFSVQFTLHQGLNCSWIKLLSSRSWQNFKTSAEKKLSSFSKCL